MAWLHITALMSIAATATSKNDMHKSGPSSDELLSALAARFDPHRVDNRKASGEARRRLEQVVSHEYSVYAVTGPYDKYCKGNRIYNSETETLDDCLHMCNSYEECRYASYFNTTTKGWCRLTSNCAGFFKMAGRNITIFVKSAAEAEEAPAAGAAKSGRASDGFERHAAPASTFCSGAKLYNGKSGGQADCEAKCQATPDCNFYSYWLSSRWCRLTESCTSKATSTGKQIVIYAQKVAKAPDYELHVEEGRCKDAAILESQTDGVEDCAELCLEERDCRFFSVMAGGWCKLTVTCDDVDLTDMDHADIYKLPDPTTPVTAGDGKRTPVPDRVWSPNAISIDIAASVAKGPGFEPLVANAISTCTMQAIEPDHVAFSYLDGKTVTATVLVVPPAGVHLEQVFNWLRACDRMEEQIERGLEAMELQQGQVGVSVEAPQLVDTTARPKAAASTKSWCCMGSWLFDDPCSECTPSLTPRGVAVGGHPCASSEGACLSCNETWADPTWCPGLQHHVIM